MILTKKQLLSAAALSAAIIPAINAGEISINNQGDGVTLPKQPNIIYILADDAGYGDAGCYGQKGFQTPNIDRLAEEGIRFTDHYAGAPVCAPSRCTLLTGYHTGHSVIRGNKELQPEGQQPMPKETITVASLLKQSGYKTGATGKWGLGYPGSEGMPTRQGFDYFYGYICQRQAHNYYPNHIWENENKIKLDGKTYSHDLIAQKALDFIQDNKDDPFFLYVPFAIPHSKLQVPDLAPYANKPWNKRKKKFAAMMHRMDQDIGRIIDLVDQLGLAEDTLIIYSSDNGPHNEGGADPKFFNSNGNLRGMKRDLYEGGIRIPMVARWKGIIAENSISSHVSAFWDILPTLSELAGITAPEGIDGISMVPALLGKTNIQHDYLYWEFQEQGGKQAIRMGKWKGVRLNAIRNHNAPIELYNLDEDPSEKHNIAKRHPEVIDKMIQLMKDGRTESTIFDKLN